MRRSRDAEPVEAGALSTIELISPRYRAERCPLCGKPSALIPVPLDISKLLLPREHTRPAPPRHPIITTAAAPATRSHLASEERVALGNRSGGSGPRALDIVPRLRPLEPLHFGTTRAPNNHDRHRQCSPLSSGLLLELDQIRGRGQALGRGPGWFAR